MARVNKSQFAILGFLSKKDMSGYDMKCVLAKVANFYWAENNAQLYPILKKLEKEGAVTSRLDPEKKSRKRCIYSITPKGLSLLQDWLTLPIEMPQYREEILLKLVLGHNMPLETSIQHIEEYQAKIIAQEQLLDAIEQHIENEYSQHKAKCFLSMTYNYYRHLLIAKKQWCKETLDTLQHIKQTPSLRDRYDTTL